MTKIKTYRTYRVMLEALIEAALDQANPSPRLKEVLDDALRMTQHPLARPRFRKQVDA